MRLMDPNLEVITIFFPFHFRELDLSETNIMTKIMSHEELRTANVTFDLSENYSVIQAPLPNKGR